VYQSENGIDKIMGREKEMRDETESKIRLETLRDMASEIAYDMDGEHIDNQVDQDFHDIQEKRLNALESGIRAIERLFFENEAYSRSLCEVCWTSSWAPVPKDYPNSQKVKDKDEWVICQMCEADERIKNLFNKLNEVKNEKDKN
jgi:hypothetical protein